MALGEEGHLALVSLGQYAQLLLVLMGRSLQIVGEACAYRSSHINVHGIPFPTPAYEQFRIVGLPAIVEHHITAGVGYEFSQRFSANLAFVHAFENDIKETSAGNAIVLESELSEWSLDFGLTWRF